ncbi:arginine/serine-rich coiled-coil protein 2-like isoform X2 [Myxocyprinus asiaticus]|uniref:arginine/serine-rich coiled-coil protein 2-like isoform X2 n=1 Tax=Myxocyprinus asiaticus TaxID=70543 RepID=UPI002221EE38|nr:arginine/serine-rich coiled-coil protein 2-like isoform X2 [Myxocyprinus asiaticus]
MMPTSTTVCLENHRQMKIVEEWGRKLLKHPGARNIHAPDHAQWTENESQESRGTDEAGAEAKRDQFFLKQARKKDSEKALKCRSGLEEQQELSDKGRDRLSEGMEEGHRRKERKSFRTRSMSRSRSRERRHHSRNRDKRRSRSRSGDRRSRSHEKKRRARSRSNSRSKHRHCSKSRSKSREKKKRTDKVRKKSRSGSVSPVTFRGRNTAMDAQEALARRLERAKKLQEQKEKDLLEKQQQEKAAAAPLLCDTVTATASPALNVAALLASGTQVTPQIAMAAQMAALQAKTLAETGIAVPGYYNPSAVNPTKFAEQEKKRKMLWQGKKEGEKSQTAELWEKLNFGNKDQNVKFRKLMGIKGEEEGSSSGAANEEGLKTLQQQEEMFRNLDVQYEMARSQTHTQRGMGLGFSSSFSSRGMDAV